MLRFLDMLGVIKYFNTLSIFDHNLNIINSYKKINLVPFGEFLHFEKLLKHDLDIVSGIYKKSDELFACCKLDGKTLCVDDEIINGVSEVMANGMGFMLVKSKVFDFIHKPFENLNDDQWEDFGFANKAREAGFKVHIDGNVIIGHEKKKIL